MLLLLFLGIPVAVACSASLGLDQLYTAAAYRAIGTRAWATSNDILLITIRCSSCSARSCCAPLTERMYGAMGGGWPGCQAG